MRTSNAVTGRFARQALLLAYAIGLSAEQLPIKIYTDADGLTYNNVRRIIRDSRGFLWFCAGDRLSRYDGYRFSAYDVGVGFSDIVEGTPGVYWLATYGRGVVRFSASAPPGTAPRMTTFSMGSAPAANFINALYRDQLGRIWAGTDNGLYVLDVTHGESIFRRVELGIQSPPGILIEVGALAEDREGSIWIGTARGPVRRLPDGRMIHYEPPPPDRVRFVRALLADADGRMWIGHSGGLVVLFPEPAASIPPGGQFSDLLLKGPHAPVSTDQEIQIPTDPGTSHWFTQAEGMGSIAVRALKQFSDGTIMAGTLGAGVFVYTGGRLRGYTIAHGLSDNVIFTLAEDLEGNRWMGTAAGGAMKLARSGFTTYGLPDGLARARVISIFETRSGEVCVVTQGGRIHLFDGRGFSGIQIRLPAVVAASASVGREIYPAIQDHTGEWWVSSGRGIHRFRRVTRLAELVHRPAKAIYTPRGFYETDALFEDSQEGIWLGMRSGHQVQTGISRWERRTEALHIFSEDDGLPPFAWPQSFAEDASGNVWIGLYEGGLIRYTNGRFHRLAPANALPPGIIRSLYCDSRGRLWIGTNLGGAAQIEDPASDRPRIVIYSMAQGLATNNVLGITEDQWGRIYLGTSRGVDRLEPATGRIRHFTSADGMNSGEVTTAFRDRGGALWFGTSHGLSRLVPQLEARSLPPHIWISGVRVAGTPKPVSELGEAQIGDFRLEPGQTQIHIDFFGFSFSQGDILRYQYRIAEGKTSEWSAPSEQRGVDFANLAPGRYRFEVRALNSEGLVSATAATASFYIAPPIWRRGWFLCSTAVFAGLVLLGFHRYRLTKLLELERVRTRIATDLHDDIGSTLSQISVLSEVVSQRVGRQEGASEPLSAIAGLSRDLVDSLNDIVWAINPNRDSLRDLTQRMRRFANDFVGARPLEFNFHVPVVQHDLKMGADVRREVFLIFKEGVNNAIRHADCAHVQIDFLVRDGWIELQVKDDGKGFDRAQPTEGNGLWSMRRRAEKLGGVLEVESSNGDGTTVRLRAPLSPRKWARPS